MSYSTQAKLARDQDVLERVTACAASLGIKNPTEWVWSIQWVWSAQAGWDQAYSDALTAGKSQPGLDEDIITDEMILIAVNGVLASVTTSVVPTTAPVVMSKVDSTSTAATA
jgi:hypothetical protein